MLNKISLFFLKSSGYYIVTKIQFFIFPFLFSSSIDRRRQPAVFAFVGMPRQSARTNCVYNRYCPSPPGIVTLCVIRIFIFRVATTGDACTVRWTSLLPGPARFRSPVRNLCFYFSGYPDSQCAPTASMIVTSLRRPVSVHYFKIWRQSEPVRTLAWESVLLAAVSSAP